MMVLNATDGSVLLSNFALYGDDYPSNRGLLMGIQDTVIRSKITPGFYNFQWIEISSANMDTYVAKAIDGGIYDGTTIYDYSNDILYTVYSFYSSGVRTLRFLAYSFLESNPTAF